MSPHGQHAQFHPLRGLHVHRHARLSGNGTAHRPLAPGAGPRRGRQRHRRRRWRRVRPVRAAAGFHLLGRGHPLRPPARPDRARGQCHRHRLPAGRPAACFGATTAARAVSPVCGGPLGHLQQRGRPHQGGQRIHPQPEAARGHLEAVSARSPRGGHEQPGDPGAQRHVRHHHHAQGRCANPSAHRHLRDAVRAGHGGFESGWLRHGAQRHRAVAAHACVSPGDRRHRPQ